MKGPVNSPKTHENSPPSTQVQRLNATTRRSTNMETSHS